MSPLYALLLIPAIVVAFDLKGYGEKAESFFDDADRDNDGKVYLPEIDSYFKTLDTNKDSELDVQEFKVYIDSNHPKLSECSEAVYKYFDRSGDGSLEADDLKTLFLEADASNDEVITRPEFVAHFSPMMEFLEEIC